MIIKLLRKLNFDLGSKVKNNTIRRYSTDRIILKFDELPEIN